MAERLSPSNADSAHTNNYKKFISAFLNSHGSLQILIVSTLYAISVGSVLGLVRYTFHRTSHLYLANVFFSTTITLLLTSTYHDHYCSQVPETLADRYARINHGFTDHCRNYAIKPPACDAGSEDAKSAAAWSHVPLSVLLLLVNPIVSSLSDVHGRKPVILLALTVSCIPAFVFYLLLLFPKMNPVWYYVSQQSIYCIELYIVICRAKQMSVKYGF
jgi:MFS family permease